MAKNTWVDALSNPVRASNLHSMGVRGCRRWAVQLTGGGGDAIGCISISSSMIEVKGWDAARLG
jgi:hypothetical protein